MIRRASILPGRFMWGTCLTEAGYCLGGVPFLGHGLSTNSYARTEALRMLFQLNWSSCHAEAHCSALTTGGAAPGLAWSAAHRSGELSTRCTTRRLLTGKP